MYECVNKIRFKVLFTLINKIPVVFEIFVKSIRPSIMSGESFCARALGRAVLLSSFRDPASCDSFLFSLDFRKIYLHSLS